MTSQFGSHPTGYLIEHMYRQMTVQTSIFFSSKEIVHDNLPLLRIKQNVKDKLDFDS